MDIRWNYHVMQGFVVREYAREFDKKLEVKNFDTDQWEDQSNDSNLWQMLRQGQTVTEEEANDTYEYFKQRLKS